MSYNYVFLLATDGFDWTLDLNDDCFKSDIYFDFFESFNPETEDELSEAIWAAFPITKPIKQLPFELNKDIRDKFISNIETNSKTAFVKGIKALANSIVSLNELDLYHCTQCINPKLNTDFFYIPEMMNILYNPQKLSCDKQLKDFIRTTEKLYIQKIYQYHW